MSTNIVDLPLSKLDLQTRNTHSLKKHKEVMYSCNVTVERIHLLSPHGKFKRD